MRIVTVRIPESHGQHSGSCCVQFRVGDDVTAPQICDHIHRRWRKHKSHFSQLSIAASPDGQIKVGMNGEQNHGSWNVSPRAEDTILLEDMVIVRLTPNWWLKGTQETVRLHNRQTGADLKPDDTVRACPTWPLLPARLAAERLVNRSTSAMGRELLERFR
jgi:hypothetical protein